MFLDFVELIEPGEANGNNRIFRLILPSGREIIGLATENNYGGEWDLGPTWNYIVGPKNPFLVDTGRSGMGKRLLEMLGQLGIEGKDLDFVLISHGHEDHDGGLAEIVAATGLKVRAHPVYNRLIRYYPRMAPSLAKETFSASCWHCFMPESFTQVYCQAYHQERNALVVEDLEDSIPLQSNGIQVHHLPGHSPDSLAVQIGDEALIIGDIILPEITPHPSQEAFYRNTDKILSPLYSQAESLYGLRAYLASLKRLKEIADQFPNLLVLPGHRLFYNNQWNELDIKRRVAEILEHHIQRCAAILTILKKGPKPVEEVAREHFDPKQLKGFGSQLAVNEILSHAEFLQYSQDLRWNKDGTLLGLGSNHFESLIRNGTAIY